MTKALLRSLLKNTLAQIDKTAKWHDNYLDHILEACISSLVYEAYASNPKALGQYTKRFRLQAVAVGDAGRRTCDLTVKLIPLPDKRGGVRSMVFTDDPDVYFVPVTDQELLLMEESQAGALVTTTPDVIYYVVRPNTIEMKGVSTAQTFYTLQLDLLVAFTSLVDTDNVPLPYGKEAEVLKMALEILNVVPPKDLLDNNSDIK